MTFARRVFAAAGLYGLAVLLPMYFLEDRLGRELPPPINHPEYFYGFVGVAVAWQAAFLVLATDPLRYRPLMLPAILEKLAYGVAVLLLYAQGRVSNPTLVTGSVDLVLGALFAASYVKTSTERVARESAFGFPPRTRRPARW
jgi:hypothetical protein